ncbi:hypothetical protein [Curtobacterium sp. VKM Ac-1376]|uniref:hypothetical protein n=1 Tax=Curtobacterium sp. VKM Ac-1376 TaxID=123312 RepID=UPI00188AFEC6|nr:hypothetical protein [Curtobacterium sp. VKM Ac-1376]MBF4616413.1 hypothetical protein [Curtobacterium sp. VKM Ac-1376]
MKRYTLVAIPLLAVLGASGCSTSGANAGEQPSKAATSATIELAGSGAQEKEAPIPSTARSIVIDVTCDGGGVLTVTTNSGATRIGRCDGEAQFTLPTPKQQQLRLNVFVGDNVEMRATAEFKDDTFKRDDDLAAACDIVSAAQQALTDNDPAAERSAGAKLQAAAVPASVRGDARTLAREYAGGAPDNSGAQDRVNAACMNNDTPVTTSSTTGG